MNYRQLRKVLQEMNDSRLNDDVTIYMRELGEYIPATSTKQVTETETDVLDEGHLVIVCSWHYPLNDVRIINNKGGVWAR